VVIDNVRGKRYNVGRSMGYRLMVGRLTLDQVVGVRIPVPQPHAASLYIGAALLYLICVNNEDRLQSTNL
jgi:hypothetical protein